jgi:hypothetical protein
MNKLKIELVENGYVVYVQPSELAYSGRMYAFESLFSLTQWLVKWVPKNMPIPEGE